MKSCNPLYWLVFLMIVVLLIPALGFYHLFSFPIRKGCCFVLDWIVKE